MLRFTAKLKKCFALERLLRKDQNLNQKNSKGMKGSNKLHNSLLLNNTLTTKILIGNVRQQLQQ